MIRQSLFIHIIMYLLMVPAAHSVVPDAYSLMEEANQAYIRAEYAYAAELYEEILASGLESAELYYNLGNAYFKQNRLADAILNYERARLLKPFDENIRYNLELARSRTTDRIEPVPAIFYERWWKHFLLMQSVDGWAVTALVLLLGALVLALVYFFSSRPWLKRLAFFFSLALILLTGLGFLAANRQYVHHYLRSDAIVFSPRIPVKSAPGEASPDLFVIHEGTRVSVTGELGGWVEIRLDNGNMGWVHREHIRAVREYAAETP